MAQTVELNADGSPRNLGPDPLIGRELLHYRVVEAIGQGGMSVVYRGRDLHLQRDVAIKVLHPFLAEKAECRARLAREARAVARLEHPHILKVFDFSGETPTEAHLDSRAVRGFAEGFIIAELVRGGTLKRFAEEHQLWRCPEAGAMTVWQVARALQHAHEHGVVHRDIKPENVMVREDGWLKLMDFGIAQIADQKGLTVTGTLLGSPAHMAPESIDGYPADERSDVFSLGTVLYWLTTGCLPFEALTPHALLKQIAEGKAVPAQQRSPRISDELGRVIAKAMATRPEDRYQSAAALAEALEEILDKSGVPADAERLRRFLAAPHEQLELARRDVRAAFLRRAEQCLEHNATARALSCLNRVLAENKDDDEARALLERAQDGLEDDVGGGLLAPGGRAGEHSREPGLSATAAAAGSSHRADIAATGAGQPSSHEAMLVALPTSTRFGRFARQIGLVALASGLITGAVVVATRFEAPSSPPPSNAVLDPPPLIDEETSTGEPARTESPALAAGGNRARPDQPRRETSVRPQTASNASKLPPGPVHQEASPAAPVPVARRVVTLRVKPWADVFIDGALVATGTKRADVELLPGPHVVIFKNPGAKDAEERIEVPATGPVRDVVAELEPMPSFLVVNCNVPDAFVSVDGKGGKPASATRDAALVVPLGGSSTAVHEVIVHKQGYETYLRRVEFQAGKTRTLEVVLEPAVDGPKGDRQKPRVKPAEGPLGAR